MPAADQYAQAMAALTAAREQQMPDECTVTREAALPQTPVLDVDGNVTDPPDATVYTGPCTISDPGLLGANQGTVNDQSGTPNMRVAKLPHRARLQPGDLITITAAAYSPGLVGDTFLVYGEDERSYATYRRYLVRGSSWLSPESGTSPEPESS